MDCSPTGSSVHGILQARVLEWGAIAFSGPDRYEPVIVLDSQITGGWLYHYHLKDKKKKGATD